MNILYLGDINSIHDFKWVSFFGEKEDTNVYFITEKENYATVKKQQIEKWNQAGVKLLPPINNFSIQNPFKTFKTVSGIKKQIEVLDIQIFHVLFGSPQPIWFNFLPKNLKKVVTTRGSDVLVLLRSLIESTSRKDKILKKLLLGGFQKSDAVVSTSDTQINFLKDQGIEEEKLHLVKTGVDVQRINNQSVEEKIPTQNEKFIFSARYISQVYNMEYQLEAIKVLPDKILEEYSFLFIKKAGDESEFYESFKSALNEIPNLKYDIVEGLSQNQIWATLKASSLTYMVPKSDGTPNTALECMAGEVPFIMGNLNYNKELFDNVCLISDLSSPKDFVSKIEEALTDYPTALLKRAKEIVSKFGDRKAEMEKLGNIYKKLSA